MKKADWTWSKDSGAISSMACLGWGLLFEESILEERILGYVGVLLWKIPISSHSLCKKRKCINVNLIIPNRAPGQLPPPANHITRQWKNRKNSLWKNKLRVWKRRGRWQCRRCHTKPGGRCSARARWRRDREEHFRWFAIHSHGNSISRKIPLQQMKEFHSSLGKKCVSRQGIWAK